MGKLNPRLYFVVVHAYTNPTNEVWGVASPKSKVREQRSMIIELRISTSRYNKEKRFDHPRVGSRNSCRIGSLEYNTYSKHQGRSFTALLWEKGTMPRWGLQ